MAVGTYALITLQELKDQLGITVSTDDTQLERAIDRATARIEAFCGRLIKSRAHQEWYGGNSTRAIRLKQYPVTVIAGVYTGIRTAFTFASTDPSDIRDTITITQEFDGISSAGATVNRTTSTGSTTTTTLAFSTYDDVDALVEFVS